MKAVSERERCKPRRVTCQTVQKDDDDDGDGGSDVRYPLGSVFPDSVDASVRDRT